MTVGEACNRVVVITGPGTAILKAAQLMREYHVGNLVVVERRGEANVPLGIVTDRDLVMRILAQEVDPALVTLGDVMSAEPVVAAENEDLWEAVERMKSHGFRRLPVVSDSGALAGILALDDVLDLAAELLGNMAAIVGRQVERESTRKGSAKPFLRS
jgi:CBS domain-containing protein